VAIEAHGPTGTKWHALQWLLDRWDLGARDVVAVGDDVNDIPMLEAAGLSYAMGNAVPEVKAVADRLTAGNDENGVAKALEAAFGL
jgi:hydroxymethylpyrimidine pyrophosphatase-like HAD family hydrolase